MYPSNKAKPIAFGVHVERVAQLICSNVTKFESSMWMKGTERMHMLVNTWMEIGKISQDLINPFITSAEKCGSCVRYKMELELEL